MGSIIDDEKPEETIGKTPALDNFGRDITELARQGKIDPIIGREDEIEKVCQTLTKRKKNNPILVGAPGCVLKDTIIKVKKVSNLTKHRIVEK